METTRLQQGIYWVYNPPQVDRIWGMWGSYYNIFKAICYLLKRDPKSYSPKTVYFAAVFYVQCPHLALKYWCRLTYTSKGVEVAQEPSWGGLGENEILSDHKGFATLHESLSCRVLRGPSTWRVRGSW